MVKKEFTLIPHPPPSMLTNQETYSLLILKNIETPIYSHFNLSMEIVETYNEIKRNGLNFVLACKKNWQHLSLILYVEIQAQKILTCLMGIEIQNSSCYHDYFIVRPTKEWFDITMITWDQTKCWVVPSIKYITEHPVPHQSQLQQQWWQFPLFAG